MMPNTETTKETKVEKQPLPEDKKAKKNGKSSDEAVGNLAEKTEVKGKTILNGVERIENLMEQQRALGADIREIKAELKGQGVPTTALNHVIRLRKMEDDIRKNFEEDVTIIKDACNMQLSLFEQEAYVKASQNAH